MHYMENGEWRASEDLVESFPGGAVARRGPNKAIFSDELNAETVFDLAYDSLRDESAHEPPEGGSVADDA